jgi:hypothetical protein
MIWDNVAEMVQLRDGQFCLKDIMSVADAKRAVQIGCTGIVFYNHGGPQLDGSRAPFDQLAEIVEAVGDQIDMILDGGIQRGTHVLKALSLGAKAVGVGRALHLTSLRILERAKRPELKADYKNPPKNQQLIENSSSRTGQVLDVLLDGCWTFSGTPDVDGGSTR